MGALDLLKYVRLAYLSRPTADRFVYRLIRRKSLRSIVEIGLGSGMRAQQMIAQASRHGEVRYTGIDLFEARPQDQPGIPFKEAHRALSRLRAKVRLVPGDPFCALARCANDLTGTDLLVISGDQDAEALQRTWFYVPRMLHSDSVVCWEKRDDDNSRFQVLTKPDVEALAGDRRAAA